MFLHKRFHKDNPSVSGFGQGSFVRRPVIFLISPDSPQSTIYINKYLYFLKKNNSLLNSYLNNNLNIYWENIIIIMFKKCYEFIFIIINLTYMKIFTHCPLVINI